MIKMPHFTSECLDSIPGSSSLLMQAVVMWFKSLSSSTCAGFSSWLLAAALTQPQLNNESEDGIVSQ